MESGLHVDSKVELSAKELDTRVGLHVQRNGVGVARATARGSGMNWGWFSARQVLRQRRIGYLQEFPTGVLKLFPETTPQN